MYLNTIWSVLQRRLLATLILNASLASAVAAQPSPASVSASSTAPVVASRPIAMAVSGGISKGSYQGGFMLGLIRSLREVEDSSAIRDRLIAVTGASAGNINALLSAIEYCRIRSVSADSASFARAWLPVGVNELLIPRGLSESQRNALGPSAALLSSLALDTAVGPSIFAMMREAGQFRPGCAVPIGITVTRKVPLSTDVGGALRAPMTRFAVVVNARTQPDGTLALEQFFFLDPAKARAVGGIIDLPHSCTGLVDSRWYLKAILASSAFPVAFAPVILRHRERRVGADVTCGLGLSDTASFLDGGVFDNNPVGLLGAMIESVLSAKLIAVRPASTIEPRSAEIQRTAADLSDATIRADSLRSRLARLEERTTESCDSLIPGCVNGSRSVPCSWAIETSAPLGDACPKARVIGDSIRTINKLSTDLRARLSYTIEQGNRDQQARTLAEFREFASKVGLRTYFVDPDAAEDPANDEVESATGSGSYGGPVSELRDLIAGFLPSARAYELQIVGRTAEPWFLKSIRPTTRSTKIVGSSLSGFGAFLHRRYRDYDYIVGLADGLREGAESLVCAYRTPADAGCVRDRVLRVVNSPGFLTADQKDLVRLLIDGATSPSTTQVSGKTGPLRAIHDALKSRPVGSLQESGCASRATIDRLICVAGLTELSKAVELSGDRDSSPAVDRQLYRYIDDVVSQLRYLEERSAKGRPGTAIPRLVGVVGELSLHSLSTYYRDDPSWLGLSMGPLPCRGSHCRLWYLPPHGKVVIGTGGATDYRRELSFRPWHAPVAMVPSAGVQLVAAADGGATRGIAVYGASIRWLRPSALMFGAFDGGYSFARSTEGGCPRRTSGSVDLGATLFGRLFRVEVRSERAAPGFCRDGAPSKSSPAINGRGRLTWFVGTADASGALHAVYRMWR